MVFLWSLLISDATGKKREGTRTREERGMCSCVRCGFACVGNLGVVRLLGQAVSGEEME